MRTLGTALGVLLASSTQAAAYENFQDLVSRYKAGVDYRIESRDSASEILVIAIHGGMIEPGTTPLSRAIAGDDLRWYSFQGTMPANNWDLHLTSSKFDDPTLLALAAKSRLCLSIHGCKGKTEFVCLGGKNDRARAAVGGALRKLGIETREFCENLEGTDGLNPVNRTREAGVQLELSRALRDRLRNDPAFERRLADAIRSTLGAAL